MDSMNGQPGENIDVNDFDDVFNDGNDAALADGIDGAGLGLATGLTDLDPTNGNLALQPSPLVNISAAQVQRLNEYCFFGSTARVAWSRPGHIARIVANGSTVEVTGQRYDTKTLEWKLIPPYQLPPTFENAVAIAWSPNGFELAIVDVKGGVYIFTLTPTCFNRLVPFRDGSAGQGESNELHRPVGLFWLSQFRNPTDKKKTVLESSKVNGKWRNETIEGLVYPPYQIRALCTISRNATFSIFFVPPEGGQYRDTSISLTPNHSTLLTHATMAQTSTGRVIVALHSVSNKISIHFVDIVFTPNEPLPALSVELVDRHVPAAPPYFDTEDMLVGVERWMLTHLQILPEFDYSIDHLPHKPAKQPVSVMAVYTSFNPQLSALDPSFLGPSVIKKWQLVQSQFELHPLFGTTGDPEPLELVVQNLPDTRLAGTVSGLQILEPGNALAITTLDGTTTFWDPDTMMPLSPSTSMNPITVASIGQTIISYPLLESIVEQCASPQIAVMAVIDGKGKLQLTKTRHQDVAQIAGQKREIDPDSLEDEALIAGLILGFSRSCWTNANFDDIISSISETFTTSSMVLIRRQLYHTLFQAKSFVPGPSNSSDLEKVSHSPIVYKALTFHLGLFDLDSPDTPRTDKISYLWTWVVVNLKYSVGILTETWKAANAQLPQGQKLPAISPTFLETVIRNVEWTFAVFNFIFQTVVEVSDRAAHPDLFKHAPATFETMLGDEAADGTQGLVALLLNCHWSRAFLLMFVKLCRFFISRTNTKPVTFGILSEQQKREQSESMDENLARTPNGKIAQAIQRCVLRHGISINAMEAITDPKWFLDIWRDESANNVVLDRQIEMMITGVVSETYQGTMRSILDNCINSEDGLRAKGEIDKLKLLQEMPELSYILLNIDDISFYRHKPTVRRNEAQQSAYQSQIASFFANGHTNGIKRDKPYRVLYDIHKKVPLFTQYSSQSQPGQTSTMTRPKILDQTQLLAAQVRRCARCGSLSDEIEAAYRGWPKMCLHLMNRCVCDGVWILEVIGDGLAD